MLLNKNIWCVLIAVALFAIAPYAMAQPPMGCQNGFDGSCNPRRVAFGYYPTTWRRWPTEKPAAPTKAEPENVRPPATKEPVQKEETQPLMTPEENVETPPTRQPEQGNEPMTLPFDDQPEPPPKEPPGGFTEPGVEPQDAFPSRPPRARPPDGDEPPAMPDDNPFKDDPPEPPQSSSVNSSAHTAAHEARPPKPTDQPAAPRWRVTAESHQAVADGAVAEAPNGPEPKMLVVAGDAMSLDRGAPRADVQAGQNPLRSSTPKLRKSQVVVSALDARYKFQQITGSSSSGEPATG